MKEFQKTILQFLLSLLIITASGSVCLAQDITSPENNVIKPERKIRLHVTNKPISAVFNKLAQKAKFKLVISPDFKDGKVSLTFRRTGINEILNTLAGIGNLSLENRDGTIFVKSNSVVETPITEMLSLKYVEALKAAYVLDKINTRGQQLVSYDEISNSVILQGDKASLETNKALLNSIDVPRNRYSTTLINYNAKQVAKMLKEEFDNTSVPLPSSDNADSLNISPVLDETLGYILKGNVRKQYLENLPLEKPVIISDESNNQIIVIGNSYQVNKARTLISYLEETTNSVAENKLTEENKENTNKADQTNLENDLKEANLKLSDAIVSQVNTELELENAKKTIEQLQIEINNLKGTKLWNSLVKDTELQNRTDAKIAELQSKIADMEAKVTSTESALNAKVAENVKLHEQLTNKDLQIETLTDRIKELQEKLANSLLKKEEAPVKREVSDETVSLIASTLQELNDTKQELNKVKQQLNDSKHQLELIYGGKLLESPNKPSGTSQWFK